MATGEAQPSFLSACRHVVQVRGILSAACDLAMMSHCLLGCHGICAFVTHHSSLSNSFEARLVVHYVMYYEDNCKEMVSAWSHTSMLD